MRLGLLYGCNIQEMRGTSGIELFCGSRLWPGTCQPSLAEFLEAFARNLDIWTEQKFKTWFSVNFRSRSSMAVATVEIISMEADGVKWERVGATLKHLKLGALKKIRFPDCLSKDARVSYGFICSRQR